MTEYSRKATGKERNRFYRASEVFEIINEPMDQL